jgi:ribosomal protein S18 acetylase RimI-like enzyme
MGPGPLVEIRAATPADVPAIRAVGVPAWQATHASLLPAAALARGVAELWNEYSLGAAVRSGRMLVAARDGAIVGLLESDRLDGGRAVVWKLYVAPEAQRTGIGRALVELQLARAAADGDRELWLEHHAGNAAAAAFCERLGFTARDVEDPGEAGIVWRARPTGAT